MAPDVFLHSVIHPGLAALFDLGGPQPSHEAARFMLAIALQEAHATHRYQGSPRDVGGPARGFWQFEPAGVTGVLTHRASRDLAERVARHFHVVPHTGPVTRAIEGHDRLATAIARLLILTDPRRLPADQTEGWRQYLDLWRPGRPRFEHWPENWRIATGAAEQRIGAHREPDDLPTFQVGRDLDVDAPAKDSN